MPTPPIQYNAGNIDLSPRLVRSSAVAASPSAATETTVCTLTVGNQIAVQAYVLLWCQVALTVGTNGTAVTLKIRQTDTSGSTLFSTGALTATAANLITVPGQAVDTGPTVPGQVYVVTLTVTGANAASTVSAAQLFALVV